MAPVRRYLRITKYSVLECRIYLDDPSLAPSWLLNPRNPILPRVIEAIRPLVIPKLREEKERAKKKSTKKKVVKDVIVEDDFEVSMFLTETSTRHSLLTKQTQFRETKPSMIQSNSSKLTSETSAIPIDVEALDAAPIRLEEDSDDDVGVRLADIPLVTPQQHVNIVDDGGGGGEDHGGDSNSDIEPPPQKPQVVEPDAGGNDDKKLPIDVSYKGFAIYGRVLCLVVRKRDAKTRQKSQGDEKLAGQARMENWITSTQMPVGEEAG